MTLHGNDTLSMFLLDDCLEFSHLSDAAVPPVPDKLVDDQFGCDGLTPSQLLDPAAVQLSGSQRRF